MFAKKQVIVIIVLVLLILLLIGAVAASATVVVYFRKELKIVKIDQVKQREDSDKTNQFLLSTINWSTRRRHVILFMRDQIITERITKKKLTKLEKAYSIAEQDVDECEKYTKIDPLFLLAMQSIESKFSDSISSCEGAVGLNQLMPATAMMICAAINVSYSKNILFNTRINTKLAVKLLDILFTAYDNDLEMILAAYNGGPKVAFYYKKVKSKVPQETRDYVPAVLEKWAQYKKDLLNYKIDGPLCKTN